MTIIYNKVAMDFVKNDQEISNSFRVKGLTIQGYEYFSYTVSKIVII